MDSNHIDSNSLHMYEFYSWINDLNNFEPQIVMKMHSVNIFGIFLSSLKNIQDKVKYTYDTLMKDSEFKNIDNVYLSVKSNKNVEKSKKLRDLGNKNFQSKVHEEAIRYYNESVLAAPIIDGISNEASLSLGNHDFMYFWMG